MFIDYYAVLEIPLNSSALEIKEAYKKQAKKWHPDKNNQDTTEQMQVINEAKLILLDAEARKRYDAEYLRFKNFQSTFEREFRQKEESFDTGQQDRERSYEYHNYDIQDDVLEQWIKNARRQAGEIIEETVELSKVGAQAAFNEVKSGLGCYLIGLIIFGIISFIVAVLM